MRRRSGALAAMTAVWAWSALAWGQPLPGGAWDPTIRGSEVYLGTPRAAEQPPGPACRAARAYVENVYAGRFGDIVSLFADDAQIFWPSRQADGVTYTVEVIQGRAQIDAFYRDVIGRTRPNAIPVTLLGNDTDCMMQVAAQMTIDGAPRYRLAAINHFTVDASGKVIRLISFQRALTGAPTPRQAQ